MEKDDSSAPQLPDAFALIRPSWKALKLNWAILVFGTALPIIILFLLIAVVQIVARLNGASGSSLEAVNIASVLLGLFGIWIFAPLVTAVSYWVKLKSAEGIKLSYWPAVKKSLHFFWRLLGLAICRWVIVGIGLVLLIVPGLFLWRRYLLAPYYLVDEDIGIFEAMRRSAADSKAFSMAIWGMLGIYILIQLFGIVPYVGWIFSFGLGLAYLCAGAVRYTQIKHAKKA